MLQAHRAHPTTHFLLITPAHFSLPISFVPLFKRYSTLPVHTFTIYSGNPEVEGHRSSTISLLINCQLLCDCFKRDGSKFNQNSILLGSNRCFTADDVIVGVISRKLCDVKLYSGQLVGRYGCRLTGVFGFLKKYIKVFNLGIYM